MKKKLKSYLVVVGIAVLHLFLSIVSQAQDTTSTALTDAPAFTLSDLNGNKVSLSDFKGKIVYIDFWATWCGPCLNEIPYLKALEQKFKDNPNLVFISISLDQDVDKWKKKVKAKKMGGIQLNSPDGSESKVIKAYQVNYIPQFVLIDKFGKLVELQAKRPSEEGIEESLKKELEK